MRNLTLFIPGLLGPDARYADDFMPELPSLERLLARSSRKNFDTTGYHRILANLMGLDIEPGRDVPVAAITRAVDDHGAADGIWLRVDPVNLSPDRDGLVLMDSFILHLSMHDALVVAAEVNKLVADYGWEVQVPREDRWYLRFPDAPDIVTTELSSVVGRDISAFLPAGRDAERFHTLLNEIQMQLHASDINRMREEQGELPVNSVWFWGLGSLPETCRQEWSSVFGDDAYVKGLGRITETPVQAFPAGLQAVMDAAGEDDEVLVVMQHCQAPAQYQNLQLWHQALMLLEDNWFTPVLEVLKQGDIRNLRIIGDTNEFETGWFGLKRIWRRSVPISRYRGMY